MGRKDKRIATLEANIANCRETLTRVRGERDDALQRLAECMGEEPTPDPEPPPTTGDPFAGLTLLRDLSKLGDWNVGYVAGSEGTITQTAEGIHFKAPPSTDQLRLEIQAHGDQPIPGEYGYEWEVKLPTGYVYGDASSRTVNICQWHANIPCYTGGLRVQSPRPGETIKLGTRIKGGHTSSWSGSCDQAYDESFWFSALVPRDRWVRIQARVLWHESDGWMKVWQDDVNVFSIAGVPTAGLHDQVPPGDDDGATAQKYRLGFYGRPMPDGGEMTVRNARVLTAT